MKSNHSQPNSGVICFCINCPGDEDKENSTCVLKEGAQCYAAMEEQYNPETNELEPVYYAGCLPPNEQTLLQCEGSRVPSHFKRTIKCCNFTDFCNKNLLPPYKPRANVTPPNLTMDNFLFAPMIVFSSLFIIAAIICIMYMFCKYKNNNGSRKCITKLDSIKVSKCNNNFHNYTQSSGSGDGQQLLARRTIGREVKKESLLGKGRFSEKWIVQWKGERIVMKTFTTWEEDQWGREKSIYATGLNHVNVLGFICSDYMKDGLRATFVYYHKLGSLHDYLKKQRLSETEFLTLARSATNGVQILHKEIRGTCTRPSIVHRNITSKNFLINDRGECEICDFEVALMENERFDPKTDLKVGTPRYTAPEIVFETIHSFEEFKMADIYSLGLVLWEICRRSDKVFQNYALPFADNLPEYPTMEDMKNLFTKIKTTIHELLGMPVPCETDKLIVEECANENDKSRPKDVKELLSKVTSIVKECANENNKSRPTAVRISKLLSELRVNESK